MSSTARKFKRTEKIYTSAEIDAIVREIYAAHFILWHAGYTPDEIFVQAAKVSNVRPPGLHMVVHLRYVGTEVNLFTLTVSERISDADSHRVCAAWLLFIQDGKPLMSKDELDEYVEGSLLRRQFAVVLGKLAQKRLLLAEITDLPFPGLS